MLNYRYTIHILALLLLYCTFSCVSHIEEKTWNDKQERETKESELLNADPHFKSMIEDYLESADSLYQERDYKNVINTTSRIIELDQFSSRAYYLRGNSYYYLMQPGKAINDLNSAIINGFDPRDSCYNAMALSYIQLAQYGRAIDMANAAMVFNKKDAISFIIRGNAELGNRDTASACRDWKKALELGDSTNYTNTKQLCR
jgi:tetratricopeptide (TPR) repeat protein